ncbi:hypothetical protein ACIP4X_21810 [Streptomyces sp. NPDC088817]|uniref:hypothetical protein n=1 Tax=Streptomyces sp. NPDC088817 TaxID=3365907 RepID=UPI00381F2658
MPTPTRAEEALAAVLAGVPRPSEENGDLRILDSWTVGEDTICVAYQGWWEDGSIGLRRRIGDDLPVSWVVGQILDAELGEPPGGMIEQDQRAAHIQDSPSLFGKAQLSTNDNAATVLSHLRGIGGTRPGVLRPGNLLIHGPLDMVFSPRCLRGPLPERHSGAHGRVHSAVGLNGAGCTASTLTNTPSSSSIGSPNAFARTKRSFGLEEARWRASTLANSVRRCRPGWARGTRWW